MSDTDELRAAFADGSLVHPSDGDRSIIDLSRAVARIVGVTSIEPTKSSRSLAELIGPSKHLVFVIVDGLGQSFVDQLPRDSFLALHRVAELRSVFPSTTATALTSITTGEWPNAHAVTGWWTHLTEIGGAAVLLQFVRRRDGESLAHLGVAAEGVFPWPPIPSLVPRDTLVALPERIAGSTYSKYVTGGRTSLASKSLPAAIEAVAERVRSANGPTYTYLYTHRLDTVVHAYGAGHPEARAALLELDRSLELLHEQIDGLGRIVISADHGFLDVGERSKHLIRSTDPLMGSLRFAPTGDARVLYLHATDGAVPTIRRRLKDRFGDRFLLITVDDAEDLELFGPGPLSDVARSRIGDLVAISRGSDVIEYLPARGEGKIMSQASHHSGLSPDEMLVPLIVA